MSVTGGWSTLGDRFEWLFLRPWYGGVTAVLTVMTGALASFFTDDIKANWVPFPFLSSGQLSWPATAFWICLGLVGVSLSGTQWAQSRAGARIRAELGGRADRLDEAISRIESLPPEGFLAAFQRLLGRAVRSTIAGTGANDASQAAAAIRNVLWCILDLVRAYDKVQPVPCYCANIMYFHSATDRIPTHVVTTRPVQQNHPDYDGWLILETSWSTTTLCDGGIEIDPDVPALLLPIPKDKSPLVDANGREKYRVMPGAPWSFVKEQFAGFVSIASFYEWLENRCSEDGGTIKDTEEYFRSGKGKHIKSFVSMPLILPPTDGGKDERDGRCIGVLNIHSVGEGLLKEKGGQRFAPICEPFLLLLSILVEIARSKECAASGDAHESADAG